MSNIENTYVWLLRQNAATIHEITEQCREHNEAATAKYVYDKVITPLISQGRVQRIRRGLYTAVDSLTGKPVADPIIVASKIRSEYYLGYHAALTLHGAAYSASTQTQVCVKPRNSFRKFNVGGYTIKPVYTGDTETNIQALRYRGGSIMVCGKERLLIECLDKPQHVGGWEQTLKSLETLGGVEYSQIPRLLSLLGNQKQTRVTGYVLELLRQYSVYHRHLPEDVLKTLEGMVEGQPTYLVNGVPGPLDRRWRLYVPEYFVGLLRGV